MAELVPPSHARRLRCLGFGDPDVVAAVARGGGLGVLDGADPAALRLVAARVRVPYGVRTDGPLPEGAAFAVRTTAPWTGALAEVADVTTAAEAVTGGALGLVARGGDLSDFVLLQQLLTTFDVPVWGTVAGPRTAVGALAGGAAGVVLPSPVDTEVRRIIGAEVPAAGLGTRLCRTLGTALPVVQGPMTRVSDQPGFAAAVADGGRISVCRRRDGERRAHHRAAHPHRRAPRRPALGRGHPRFCARRPACRAARRDPGRTAALCADRGRETGAGQGIGSRRHRDVPARAVADPARPVPRRRGPPVRLRGRGVWWARRPAVEFRAVGGTAGRARCGQGRRGALRGRDPRRPLGGDGHRDGRAARRRRFPDGHRVPVHRRSCDARRDHRPVPGPRARRRHHRHPRNRAGAPHPLPAQPVHNGVRAGQGESAGRPRAGGVATARRAEHRTAACRQQGRPA